MGQDIWSNEPYQMILKAMATYECLELQALLEVLFLEQTALELHAHHSVLLTLSRYHSPLEMLQSLQPTIVHIQNTNAL